MREGSGKLYLDHGLNQLAPDGAETDREINQGTRSLDTAQTVRGKFE